MDNLVGYVDGIYGATVVGWAINLQNPTQPVEVIVEIGGRIVGQGFAVNRRPDVMTAGYPTANCGFEISVPAEAAETGYYSVRAITNSAFLANSNQIAAPVKPPKRNLSWSIDSVDQRHIAGWIVDLDKPRASLMIEVVCNEILLASTLAKSNRHDVFLAGIPSQRCAFELKIKWQRPICPEDKVIVRLADDYTPIASYLYSDFIAAKFLVTGQLDTFDGRFASGWVCDLDNADRPMKVEILHNDTIIASGPADLARADVVDAGYPKLNCGFRIFIPHTKLPAAGEKITAREAQSRIELNASPVTVGRNEGFDHFINARRTLPEATLSRFRRRYDRKRSNHISIVMPVLNASLDRVNEAIISVLSQWSSNWELIVVDDFATSAAIAFSIRAFAGRDDRIVVVTAPSHGGIAAASNLGIQAAKHDVVTLMSHVDHLEPNAVSQIRKAFEADRVDIVYCDDVATSEDINDIIELNARPAFSYDYYLSHPYFNRLVSYRKSLIAKVGEYDEDLKLSYDIDLILRALEQARAVSHIPRVLYRWRARPADAGHADQKLVAAATAEAIQRSLDRRRLGCTVTPGLGLNEYRIRWPAADGKTLIIIPTKNMVEFLRKAILSIEATVSPDRYRLVIIDHESDDAETCKYLSELSEKYTVHSYKGNFNYARMNNEAFRLYSDDCRFVLLLNNDVEALKDVETLEDGWLERLCSLAARPDVGAVGPMLIYDNKQIQHAGVLVGFNGAAEHAHRFQDAYVENHRYSGYNSHLTVCRDYSAVTAACMLLKSETYEQVKGFDENLDIGFNDTDLCLRIRELGLKIIYDGFTVLYHRESATRNLVKEMLFHPDNTEYFRQRWHDTFERGDHFYNPLLRINGLDHVPGSPAQNKKMFSPRIVDLTFDR